MTKACPVVCMTAWASSKLMRLRRCENLEADPDPSLDPGLGPAGRGPPGGCQEVGNPGLGIGDAEIEAIGRALMAGPAAAGLIELEGSAELSLERRLAVRAGRLAVDLPARDLGECAPVAAGRRSLERPIEQSFVGLEEPRHGVLLLR